MIFKEFKPLFCDLFVSKGNKLHNLNQIDSVKNDDVKHIFFSRSEAAAPGSHRAAGKQIFDRFVDRTRTVKVKSFGTTRERSKIQFKRGPVTPPPAAAPVGIALPAPIELASEAIISKTSLPVSVFSDPVEIVTVNNPVFPVVTTCYQDVLTAHEADRDREISTSKKWMQTLKRALTIKTEHTKYLSETDPLMLPLPCDSDYSSEAVHWYTFRKTPLIKKTGTCGYGPLPADHIFPDLPVIYWIEVPDCSSLIVESDVTGISLAAASATNYWTVAESCSANDEIKSEVVSRPIHFSVSFYRDGASQVPVALAETTDCTELVIDEANCGTTYKSTVLAASFSKDKPSCKPVDFYLDRDHEDDGSSDADIKTSAGSAMTTDEFGQQSYRSAATVQPLDDSILIQKALVPFQGLGQTVMAHESHGQLQATPLTTDNMNNEVESIVVDDQSSAGVSRPAATKVDSSGPFTETSLSVHSIFGGADPPASNCVSVDEVMVPTVADSRLILECDAADDDVEFESPYNEHDPLLDLSLITEDAGMANTSHTDVSVATISLSFLENRENVDTSLPLTMQTVDKFTTATQYGFSLLSSTVSGVLGAVGENTMKAVQVRRSQPAQGGESVCLNKNPWIDTTVRLKSAVQPTAWNSTLTSVSRSIAGYFTASSPVQIDDIPVYSFTEFTEMKDLFQVNRA
ncbi:hypothetical protein V1512DRAFT_260910 [Lipomyces arxii]|uniref:uncharacterized protein n=1 Tax=Lipomyces arxii TaxID=56418 RepID=UPI0034CE2F81